MGKARAVEGLGSEMTIQEVLSGSGVKSTTGTPQTIPGPRKPIQHRSANAHHPNTNVEDFDWKSYPDNDEDGNFTTSVWKLSFRRKQDGMIQFTTISSPGSKSKSPKNSDLIRAVKFFKSLPLEISAGLWHYQIEKNSDQWVRLDETYFNPLDYRDVTDWFYKGRRNDGGALIEQPWIKTSGIDQFDFIKGQERPKTDQQISDEKEKVKDDEIARLRAELEKMKSKNA